MRYLYYLIGLMAVAALGYYLILPYFSKSFSREVLVYFNQVKENEIVQLPVKRVIAPYDDPMTQAIKELLKGPTEEEQAQGFSTALNEGTELNYIRVEDGAATLDFNERFDTPMGGSARVISIYQQLDRTMKQFPGISEIKLTINRGEREAVLEP